MRKEVEEAHAALTLALTALDEVGRLRVEVSMAQRRLAALLREPEVRPSSVAAMPAVQLGGDPPAGKGR